jgi:hypothetical protein
VSAAPACTRAPTPPCGRSWPATSDAGAAVGLPLETVARVLRLAEVLRRMDAGPVRRAEIAAACGYADRSHLNRDRRRRAQTYDPGATPAQGPVKEVA